MKKSILAIAAALSDAELLTRIEALACTERDATAEMVAHLAELELRPSAYLAQGHGSLFDYCRLVLRLSEDAACTRIRVARTCRAFPTILERLASGSVTLTAVRMLGPHLTAENHEAVLARAHGAAREDVAILVAELAPKPDAPPSLRKLPGPAEVGTGPLSSLSLELPQSALPTAPDDEGGVGTGDVLAAPAATDAPAPMDSLLASGAPNPPSPPRAVGTLPAKPQPPAVQPLAPHRYRLQCTIGEETRDKLRQLQALLRREIPDGDPAAIIDRAFDELLAKVERAKLGVTAKARRRPTTSRPSTDSTPSGDAYESRIRFETDNKTRHIPNAVKSEVWRRDGGQCAFMSNTGRRCEARTFLEFHHIHPYALDGPATVENISLRCRGHNQYEAELAFGPRASTVSEARASYSSA